MQDPHTIPTIDDLRAENAVLRARLEAAERILNLCHQEQRIPPPASAPSTTSLQVSDLLPQARAALHELAQPLNTAACYAVAARNLATKSAGDKSPLCNALRSIDQQIQLAGAVMERLRQLLGQADTSRPVRSNAPGSDETA